MSEIAAYPTLPSNAAPFPAPGQPTTPASDQGAESASTLLEGAGTSSKLAASFFQNLWDHLARGNEPIYITVVAVCLLFAVIFLAPWAAGWYRKFSMYGFSPILMEETIWPVLVCLMLGVNNGALLAHTSIFYKDVFLYLNSRILSSTEFGLRIDEAIKQTGNNQAFIQSLESQIRNCQALPQIANTMPTTPARSSAAGAQRTQKDCVAQVAEQAKKEAQAYEAAHPQYFNMQQLLNDLNPLNLAGRVVNKTVRSFLYLLLISLQGVYQIALQMSFYLAALGGPIALTASLLPMGQKPVFAWLAGFTLVGMSLVSFSIMVGLVASHINQAGQSNPLLLPLFEGVAAPVLATGIGLGSAMAVYSGLMKVAAFAVRL